MNLLYWRPKTHIKTLNRMQTIKMEIEAGGRNCQTYRGNVYIQFPSVMQLFTFTILPLTQHVSAANGHPQVFHYAKPATLHVVSSNPWMCLKNLWEYLTVISQVWYIIVRQSTIPILFLYLTI
jgi:hypothetical protein